MLLVSTLLLSTASFAWFSMNTSVDVGGIEFEAYSDSLFLEISTSRDGDYAFSIDDVGGEEKSLRPVSTGALNGGALKVEFTEITDDTERYSLPEDPQNPILYYTKLTKSATNDSMPGFDYIAVNGKLKPASSVAGYYNATDGKIVFNLITSGNYDADAGVIYYEKVGNAYKVKTLSDGDKLFGLYSVIANDTDACASDERYEAGKLYFEKKSDGYYPVGGLSLGTSLKGYYTVASESQVTVADGVSCYYITNNRGDYISLGTPPVDTQLNASYTYWCRGYSSTHGSSEGDNTVGVVDTSRYTNEENPYYLYDVFYLRMASGASAADNLRVSEVSVEGSDSIANAVRILFIATSDNGMTSRAIYDNRTKTITHLDRVDERGKGVLFETLLGNKAETVEVEVYIYYDGRDADVKTAADVVMSGQTVGITFSIDVPEYLETE